MVYYMIIMRTSFMSIPAELEEAVKIDGGGHWCMLFKIVIPLSKAIIAVMILYYGVGYWNSWFEASIYIRDRSLFPLQLVLRDILIANDTSTMTTSVKSSDQEAVGETIKYAIIIFSIVPILLVYPFLQKYFVKGVMIGAVKG
jgi:putative aldouronate transport system permease protein